MVLGGSIWKVRDRPVIGRSSVRIRPRAPEPHARGHFQLCRLRSGNRRSFVWVGSVQQARRPASLRRCAAAYQPGQARTPVRGRREFERLAHPGSWRHDLLRPRRHSRMSSKGIAPATVIAVEPRTSPCRLQGRIRIQSSGRYATRAPRHGSGGWVRSFVVGHARCGVFVG